ncbi:HAMP domain-containing histidine kinase [Rhizobium sp. ARZ01]|uniref:sensor histidine kinase n=1 Tax=Rhizobium sp. ARZ01 TaxID=2769313 RepID=UPI00177BD1D5|nr:HAMP domain-containing sensor histidine kinase [Rhizobium sp. ARZ01]MBD9374590.1 HAMP domain-containing histidine kinase [Rhizobium sp. ARZ01]
MREPSITRRLTLSLAAALTGFWLLATALGVMVMQDEFSEIFDSALQETAERLLVLVVDDIAQNDESGASDNYHVVIPASGREYLTYQLRNERGDVLLRSHDAPMTPFDAPLKSGFWRDATYRFYTATPAGDSGLYLQVADALANRREALIEGAMALLLPVLLLVPASIALVWYIARRTIAPVDTLRQAIASKDSGNLTVIAREGMPRELLPIVRSVNLLLSRLKAALDAEREFTANSAHELRTPIAGALAQTQVLIDELASGPKKARARQVETSLTNLSHLAEKLLQLARAEAGVGAVETPVDLARVLELVVLDFQRDPEVAGRLRFHRAEGASLRRPASEDGFAIALRNLIENALVHGCADAPVDIRLERDGTVRIINDGHVLADWELEMIRKRFGRGRTSASGSGLGISIAERLLTQMHARLELLSPPEGLPAGLEARIRFEPDPPVEITARTA